MAMIGRFNNLEVVKQVKFGVYLDAEELGEILLPQRYVPENTQPGDRLEVFIYRDSDDLLIATTETPKAQIGEFACLKVVDLNRTGAFFDWGLPKDLLVPFSEQKKTVEKDQEQIVYLYLDQETDRIAGSTKLNKFLDSYPHNYEKGQQVDLIIEEHTHIGYKAIINGQHWGVIYDDDVFKPVRYGQRMKGFIKLVRPDGKINLSLQQLGYCSAVVKKPLNYRSVVYIKNGKSLSKRTASASSRNNPVITRCHKGLRFRCSPLPYTGKP